MARPCDTKLEAVERFFKNVEDLGKPPDCLEADTPDGVTSADWAHYVISIIVEKYGFGHFMAWRNENGKVSISRVLVDCDPAKHNVISPAKAG